LDSASLFRQAVCEFVLTAHLNTCTIRHEYVSRVRLAELTRLSTTTITNLLSELLDHGSVVEDSGDKLDHRCGVGCPRTALRLVAEARYALKQTRRKVA
jgi:hypothetical protein